MSTLWTQNNKLLISSQNKLQLCNDCPCGCTGIPWIITQPRILLWMTNNSPFASGLGLVKTYYESLGITVDTNSSWTGNLSDYCLIIWMIAESNPTWLAVVTSGGWQGRIHISGEYASGFAASNSYVNGLTSYHNILLGTDTSLGSCTGDSPATAYSHYLTQGQSVLYHASTNSVSGGNLLYKNLYLDKPMMAQYYNASITTDWVVSGDSSHITNDCPDFHAFNNQFFCNLYTKGAYP